MTGKRALPGRIGERDFRAHSRGKTPRGKAGRVRPSRAGEFTARGIGYARSRPTFLSVSFFSSLLVAQPPLPLQEFLPLQPLSLVLQPPLPLQSFLPLQSCLSA